jgi:hypothetical protein
MQQELKEIQELIEKRLIKWCDEVYLSVNRYSNILEILLIVNW